MTNCLYHRRKWLSFVFILFISNRFPSGLHAHNEEKRNIELGDVNSTENYLVEEFCVVFFIKLSINSPFLAQVAIVKDDL